MVPEILPYALFLEESWAQQEHIDTMMVFTVLYCLGGATH
jgi:hypothetical protein